MGPPLTQKGRHSGNAPRRQARADRHKKHGRCSPIGRAHDTEPTRLRRVSAEDHVTGLVTDCNAAVTSQFLASALTPLDARSAGRGEKCWHYKAMAVTLRQRSHWQPCSSPSATRYCEPYSASSPSYRLRHW